MAYINKGDLLEFNGKQVIATSTDYTRMTYNSYDHEMSQYDWYEGGTAESYVDILHPGSANHMSVPIEKIKKISD